MSGLTYYQQHKAERLQYQKQYNKCDNYKLYQQDYYKKNQTELQIQNARRRKAKRANKPTKIPQYKLDAIEAVLKRKLRDIKRQEKTITKKVVEPPKEPFKTTTTNKYYGKKLLQQYQHSLIQPPPFSGFIQTERGYHLVFD